MLSLPMTYAKEALPRIARMFATAIMGIAEIPPCMLSNCLLLQYLPLAVIIALPRCEAELKPLPRVP